MAKKQHILASLRKAEQNIFVPSGLARGFLKSFLKAVRQALRTSNKAEVKELLQQLADREKSIALEYESYRAEHPVVADLVKQYNEVQKNILKVAVVATNGVDKATLGDH